MPRHKGSSNMLPTNMPKHIKQHLKNLKAQGANITRIRMTRKSHYQITTTLGVLTIAGSPSDNRQFQNTLRDYRKLMTLHANHGSTL